MDSKSWFKTLSSAFKALSEAEAPANQSQCLVKFVASADNGNTKPKKRRRKKKHKTKYHIIESVLTPIIVALTAESVVMPQLKVNNKPRAIRWLGLTQ